ncbi:MAG TPA: tryptophan--tRNA ligase, partial [Clostridiales bacterium]|nr:tryptophan--tRNA ligase [Clostridiales bacterium]
CETCANGLAPIQERYNAILADQAYLEQIMKQGAEKAARMASKTLRKTYKKIGFYSIG